MSNTVRNESPEMVCEVRQADSQDISFLSHLTNFPRIGPCWIGQDNGVVVGIVRINHLKPNTDIRERISDESQENGIGRRDCLR